MLKGDHVVSVTVSLRIKRDEYYNLLQFQMSIRSKSISLNGTEGKVTPLPGTAKVITLLTLFFLGDSDTSPVEAIAFIRFFSF
mmetsp:Transcript_32898/g.39427  ORF Transcript_32898/g.39427 Transcript_32898/m.39427 type:complete len:83 (+) Transcript_32898:287-535(+)